MVQWDSMSVVRRRTDAVKTLIVETTERALIQVVDKSTTAASNTQTSVEKILSNGGMADANEGEAKPF